MANSPGGYGRILTGPVLADNGDGTFQVDLDGTGSGLTVVRAPVVAVGQVGTVLDIDGAQLLIGPRSGDDQPTDALNGVGSFEVWDPEPGNASGLNPHGWSGFWSSVTPVKVRPDSTWTADGVFSAVTGIGTVAAEHTGLIGGGVGVLAFTAPGQSMNLRVRGSYKPLASQAGNRVSVLVYWGTTDAEAQPFGGGKVSTLLDVTLTASTDPVAFDVTAPMPVGAYVYARVYLDLRAKAATPYVAGEVAWDGVRAEWLESGTTDTPWLPWTPVLTAATTNPNLGTAASGAKATGRYVRNGTSVSGWALLQAGTSGTAVGSGVYLCSLPLPPHAESSGLFPCQVQTSSSDQRNGVGIQFVGYQGINRFYITDSAAAGPDISLAHNRAPVNNSGSWQLRFNFTYEAALPLPV